MTGIGIDVVSIKRFEGKTEGFFQKYFSKAELEYAKSRKSFFETIAGIFALKEAFLKAIGVGVFKGIKLSELEVRHKESGEPYLVVSEKVLKKFNINQVLSSISHDGAVAVAVCQVN